VVIGFEHAETDRDRIEVLEIRFDSLTAFSRLYRERSRALAASLRDRRPEGLPACPGWMYEGCAYRAECGCGETGSRVTR
jgi:hypothetical protein